MNGRRPAAIAFRIARVAFVAAAGVAMVAVAYHVHAMWSEASTVGARPHHLFAPGEYHLSIAEAGALDGIGLSPRWHAGLVVVRSTVLFAIAATLAVLLWRRSRQWSALYVAWFLLGSHFLFWIDAADDAPRWIEFAEGAITVIGVIALLGLLLVFPDDRLAPRVSVIAAGVLTGVAVFAATDLDAPDAVVWNLGWLLSLGAFATGLTIQVVQAVRTGDRGRWLMLAFTAGGIVAFLLGMEASASLSGIDDPGTGLASLARRLAVETAVMALPVLFGVGIVYLVARRRFWDLDLGFNRAFVYSTLTALLVGTYFLVVALVQAMVNDVAGIEESTFAVVASTGLIALVALPARESVQRIIDRVFFRRRYDLERMVETFEARLRDRDRLDLLGGELLTAASEAFQPQHVALWIPDGSR
jgi:hypothetical protein